MEEEVSDDEDEAEELPDITDEMESVIQRAQGSRGQTLIDKFQIAITRKDIDTLRGNVVTTFGFKYRAGQINLDNFFLFCFTTVYTVWVSLDSPSFVIHPELKAGKFLSSCYFRLTK